MSPIRFLPILGTGMPGRPRSLSDALVGQLTSPQPE